MTKKESSTEVATSKSASPLSRTGLPGIDEMQQWFDDWMPFGWSHPVARRWQELMAPMESKIPKVDVINRDKEIVVRAAMPGIKKEDLEVTVTRHSVTLRAVTHHEEKKEDGNYVRREMSHGEYERTLTLPEGVDADATKATFRDGVLELTLPKSEQTERKSIKVE